MPVVNAEIAGQLEKIADLLNIKGANPFRVRAYRRAARLVGELPRGVADMLDAGEDLDELPGIGEDLAGKPADLNCFICRSRSVVAWIDKRGALSRSHLNLCDTEGDGAPEFRHQV